MTTAKQIQKVFKNREARKKQMFIENTNKLISKQMKKHKKILQRFSGLPKDLRKYIQTFYKSKRPENCIMLYCTNVCYETHLSDLYIEDEDGISGSMCTECEIVDQYESDY